MTDGLPDCCRANFAYERRDGPTVWKPGFRWHCRDCRTWYQVGPDGRLAVISRHQPSSEGMMPP